MNHKLRKLRPSDVAVNLTAAHKKLKVKKEVRLRRENQGGLKKANQIEIWLLSIIFYFGIYRFIQDSFGAILLYQFPFIYILASENNRFPFLEYITQAYVHKKVVQHTTLKRIDI
ncbi:hypothetical protein A0J61_09249 [Choanephora cucurbitarum]|uniref:Uncharacterized protein n=1 Tax=Choanephora cucurbitarum TaxID=101091 RepID=A0A1C7N0R7_9FUNG|nr:hypothetical protein A0J61_09249 [Choanephora cucurbitarum]